MNSPASAASPAGARPPAPISAFLESLASTEQERVYRLASNVAAVLSVWAKAYPLVRKVRIQPLALSVCAAAPFSSVEDLVAVARVSLWVFTADDIFDEDIKTASELAGLTEVYQAIAAGRSPGPIGDELAVALTDVVRGLQRFPLFARLAPVWSHAFGRTLEGMVRENRWRNAVQRRGLASAPSYRDYLKTGRYSIGGPPHIWPSVISMDDASALDFLPQIQRMERTASSCVRLANDLRSETKETIEGKVNSLRILAHQLGQVGWAPDPAVDDARRRVRSQISRDIGRLGRWATCPQTATGRPELVVANIARFVTEFYSRYDYHTFSTRGEARESQIAVAADWRAIGAG
jgi:hypothetical protein